MRSPAKPRAAAVQLVGACIRLVNEAADSAGDEEVTPSRIAAAIERALRSPELKGRAEVSRLLWQALDAVADGMPADYVGMLLYAARGKLESA